MSFNVYNVFFCHYTRIAAQQTRPYFERPLSGLKRTSDNEIAFSEEQTSSIGRAGAEFFTTFTNRWLTREAYDGGVIG